MAVQQECLLYGVLEGEKTQQKDETGQWVMKENNNLSSIGL